MKNFLYIGFTALLIINIGISSLNLQKSEERGSFSISDDIEITKISQEYLINLNLESEVYKTNKESINDLKKQIDKVNQIFDENSFDKDLLNTNSFSTLSKYDYSNGKSEEIGKYSYVDIKIEANSNDLKNEIVNALSEFDAKQMSVNPKSNKLTEKDIQKSREELIKIIKNKARNIADAGGFKLGEVKSYYENINNRTPIMFAKVSDLAVEEAMESDAVLPESKETSKLNITIDYFIE